jgi:hypothetical protein
MTDGVDKSDAKFDDILVNKDNKYPKVGIGTATFQKQYWNTKWWKGSKKDFLLIAWKSNGDVEFENNWRKSASDASPSEKLKDKNVLAGRNFATSPYYTLTFPKPSDVVNTIQVTSKDDHESPEFMGYEDSKENPPKCWVKWYVEVAPGARSDNLTLPLTQALKEWFDWFILDSDVYACFSSDTNGDTKQYIDDIRAYINGLPVTEQNTKGIDYFDSGSGSAGKPTDNSGNPMVATDAGTLNYEVRFSEVFKTSTEESLINSPVVDDVTFVYSIDVVYLEFYDGALLPQ